jgi:hypothetical protein
MVHTGALNMSALQDAAVGALRRPALARLSLMSAMVIRPWGVGGGVGSASGRLAAEPVASE